MNFSLLQILDQNDTKLTPFFVQSELFVLAENFESGVLEYLMY